MQSQLAIVEVERAAHAMPATIEHVGVDHCRAYVFVSEQFLYSAYVITCFEQVSGKAMAKGMTAGRLVEAGFVDGALHSLLNRCVGQMVSSRLAGAGIGGQRGGRK